MVITPKAWHELVAAAAASAPRRSAILQRAVAAVLEVARLERQWEQQQSSVSHGTKLP